MEKRKIIKSGEGSFVVSLPIDFVRRNALKKGSEIFVLDKGHEVLVSPEGKDVAETKTAIIDCSDKSADEIKKNIISYYLFGVSILTLRDISPSERENAIRFISLLPGLSVVSEEYNKIEVKDILDAEKVNINEYLKRTDIMIRSMFMLILENLEKKEKTELAIKGRVQGNCFFIIKMVNKILKNTSLSAKTGIELESILSLSRIVIELENISDHLYKLGEQINMKIRLGNIDEIIKMLMKSYETAITSFYKKDAKSAEGVFLSKNKSKKAIATVLENKDKEQAITIYDYLLDIEHSIKRISLIGYDIGINQTK